MKITCFIWGHEYLSAGDGWEECLACGRRWRLLPESSTSEAVDRG